MKRVFFFALGLIGLILGFQNCAGSLPDEVNSNQSVATAPQALPNPAFSASYSPNPAPPRSLVTMTVSGGTPPYSFQKTHGLGGVSGNTYSAPAIGESASIEIRDSKGRRLDLLIHIVSNAIEVPVHRSYVSNQPGIESRERVYTLTVAEIPVGFTNEGVKFHLFQSPTDSAMRPIYLCQMNGTLTPYLQFMSSDINCEGHSRVGSSAFGYAFGSQVAGTVPLYRRRSAVPNGHIMTLDPNEGGSNYLTDGPVGYVVH